MAKIKPKVVFIDTEQFDAKGLSFSNNTFARLADLVEAGQAKVLLTDVVKGEVRRHIQQRFQEARKKLGQQFGGLFSNLTVTPKPPVFADDFWQNAEAEVMAAFDSYCNKIKAEVLPVSPELVNIVFDWYFSNDVPFNSEKRKSEFPDAFSIACVNEWAKKNSSPVYVVSKDAAFSVVSQQQNTPLLTHKDSLAAFFALFPDPNVASAIKQAFVEFLNDDNNWNFAQDQFAHLDFVVEDVPNLRVEAVYAKWTEARQIHVVEANEGKAILAGRLYIHFDAEIEAVNEDIEDSTFVTAEIAVNYDLDDPSQIKITSVNYENLWPVEVSLPSRYLHQD